MSIRASMLPKKVSDDLALDCGNWDCTVESDNKKPQRLAVG